MSEITDVRTLYGSLRGTWEKVHADVVAHGILLIIFFICCGVSFPHIALPNIDAAQITGNPWFLLAKGTGVLYLTAIVPLLAIAAYGGLIRVLGQFFAGVLAILFAPSIDKSDIARSAFVLNTQRRLESLALYLRKEEFEFDELIETAYDIWSRYQYKKSEQWEVFNRSVEGYSKNAVIYLGDFCVFLMLWILIHWLRVRIPWLILDDGGCFHRGLVILVVLAGISWFRVRRSLIVMPAATLFYASEIVRADPEMDSRLDVPEEQRVRIIAARSTVQLRTSPAKQRASDCGGFCGDPAGGTRGI